MSVAKVIEITSSSEKSFQHAIDQGVARAGKTVKGMCGAWVNEQSVTIKDGKVNEYRVNLKVTFILDD